MYYLIGTGDGEGFTEENESTGDYQIVTEIWIEPQCGQVKLPGHPTASYMSSLLYHELSNAVSVFILRKLSLVHNKS